MNGTPGYDFSSTWLISFSVCIVSCSEDSLGVALYSSNNSIVLLTHIFCGAYLAVSILFYILSYI